MTPIPHAKLVFIICLILNTVVSGCFADSPQATHQPMVTDQLPYMTAFNLLAEKAGGLITQPFAENGSKQLEGLVLKPLSEKYFVGAVLPVTPIPRRPKDMDASYTQWYLITVDESGQSTIESNNLDFPYIDFANIISFKDNVVTALHEWRPGGSPAKHWPAIHKLNVETKENWVEPYYASADNHTYEIGLTTQLALTGVSATDDSILLEYDIAAETPISVFAGGGPMPHAQFTGKTKRARDENGDLVFDHASLQINTGVLPFTAEVRAQLMALEELPFIDKVEVREYYDGLAEEHRLLLTLVFNTPFSYHCSYQTDTEPTSESVPDILIKFRFPEQQ